MSASPISGHHNLLIHGKRVPTASGRYFDTLNPATEQVIAQVAEADAVDVDAAVRSSRAAFEGDWGRMRPARAQASASAGS